MRISDWSSDVCSSDLPPSTKVGNRRNAQCTCTHGSSPDRLLRCEGDDRLSELWWRKMGRVGTSSVEAINLGSCSRGLVAGTAATDQSRSFISASVNVQYCMQLPVRQRVKPAIHELYHRRSLRLRSEEHTSELQSLMRISYAAFC